MLADLGQHRVRQHLTGGQVALGAQLVRVRVEHHAVGLGGRAQHHQCLGGDFRADAVTRYQGERERRRHECCEVRSA
jgi:hypothetical protein